LAVPSCCTKTPSGRWGWVSTLPTHGRNYPYKAVEKPFTEPNPQPLCCFFKSCDQLPQVGLFDRNTTALLISGAEHSTHGRL